MQGNKPAWIVQNRVYRICQRGETNVPATLPPSSSQRGKIQACVGYRTALSNACKSYHGTFLQDRFFEVARSCLALRFPKWCWNNQSSKFVGCSQKGKMVARKAGATGTEISIRGCMVIQVKQKRAGRILSHASDLRLAGFASANPAASRSPPRPDRAFSSKGLLQRCWEAQPALPLLPCSVLSGRKTAAFNSRGAKDLWAKSVIIRISEILLLLLT